MAAGHVDARITSIEILRTESPTFGGTAFGAAGTYDKIVARAKGTLDPADPHNAVITDINLAPRNAQGLVEYSMDVCMFQLLCKAATTNQSQAMMYVKNHSDQQNVVVPNSVWSFVDNQNVKINRTDPFLAGCDNGAAFELVYTAKDPLVLAVGFAATRDLISYLRNDTTATNPAKGAIRATLAHGQSQSGRYLKGFIHWGFNADEQNRKVFDGVNPFISGAHDIASNERWGDANATGRKYQRHTIAKQEFPFTYEVRRDTESGQTNGIFLRCQGSGTYPLIVHTDSGNEPYLKPTFLVTSDGQGHDIALPSTVRLYDVGSTQHGPSTTPGLGVCQQLSNPNQWAPYVRALFVDLDLWTTAGVEPPPSAYARVSVGTAVPTPQAFPQIPGVRYTRWVNPVAVQDKSRLPYTEIPEQSFNAMLKSNVLPKDMPVESASEGDLAQ